MFSGRTSGLPGKDKAHFGVDQSGGSAWGFERTLAADHSGICVVIKRTVWLVLHRSTSRFDFEHDVAHENARLGFCQSGENVLVYIFSVSSSFLLSR